MNHTFFPQVAYAEVVSKFTFERSLHHRFIRYLSDFITKIFMNIFSINGEGMTVGDCNRSLAVLTLKK